MTDYQQRACSLHLAYVGATLLPWETKYLGYLYTVINHYDDNLCH